MDMNRNIIKQKSFSFAIRIVRLNQFLCSEKKEFVISKQLLRSGTSIGANVFESGRAVSTKDFISKIGIAQKEADETLYWIELLYATDYLTYTQYVSLKEDCEELIRILMAISKTMSQKCEKKML
jgi:four helix bundle protein